MSQTFENQHCKKVFISLPYVAFKQNYEVYERYAKIDLILHELIKYLSIISSPETWSIVNFGLKQYLLPTEQK